MVRLIKTETVISVLMGHFIKKLLFILLFVGVLIAPANAQNEKNMYSYKKIGNKYIVSINNHTEIVKALIRHSGSKWKYPTLQGIYHL